MKPTVNIVRNLKCDAFAILNIRNFWIEHMAKVYQKSL